VDQPVSDVEKTKFYSQKSGRIFANVVVAHRGLSDRKDGTRQLGDARKAARRNARRLEAGRRRREATVAGRREAGVPGSSRGPQGSRGGGRSGGSLGSRMIAGRPTGFLARAGPATGDADRSHGSGALSRSTRGGTRGCRPGRRSGCGSSAAAVSVGTGRRARGDRTSSGAELRKGRRGRQARAGFPAGSRPGPGGEQARMSRPGTIGGASALRADPRRQAAVPPGRHASDLGPARLTPLLFGAFHGLAGDRTRKRRRRSSHRRRSD